MKYRPRDCSDEDGSQVLPRMLGARHRNADSPFHERRREVLCGWRGGMYGGWGELERVVRRGLRKLSAYLAES